MQRGWERLTQFQGVVHTAEQKKKKKEEEEAQSVLFTPVNMGILWQVQSLDKHGFLPAVEIKVVCLEVDGRDWAGWKFSPQARERGS